MESMITDARYGLKALAKDRGFTIASIVALALGIGANTAIFSVVNAVLLHPLPFENSSQLAAVWTSNQTRGYKRGLTAPPDYRAWKDQNQVFSGMAAYYMGDFNITGEQPERVRGAIVSTDLFQLLGIKPALGRPFMEQEGQFGAHRVVVLGESLWRRRFGADPALVGQPLTLNGESYTVVGIMPSSQWFDQPSRQADLWVPMAFEPASNKNSRNNYFLSVVARLAPGQTLSRAQANMNTVAHQLEQEYKENSGLGVNLVPLNRDGRDDARATLLVLFGAVVFVLLIACANVANLLLSRAAAREKETALRVALGASRGRLARQWLTENVLLATLGGILGLPLAWAAVHLMVGLAPDNLTRGAVITRGTDVNMNVPVLGFTLLLSLLTGVICSLLPIVQSSKPDLNKALKEAGRSSTGGARGHRTRNALVVCEVAIALVLLIGAGLMIKSFVQLQQVNPGFRADHILSVQIPLPDLKYKEAYQRTNFYQQLIDGIKASPDVESVGATTTLPLARGGGWGKMFSIDGQPPPATLDEVPAVEFRQVTPDYFRAMGVPLKAGRYFTDQDSQNSMGVVIVNETLARQFFNGQDAVGRRVWIGPPESLLPAKLLPPGGQFPRAIIVGVVGDSKTDGLNQPVDPEVYVPHVQGGGNIPLATMFLAVRTRSDPSRAAAAIRAQVWSIDRDQPIADVSTMEQRLSDSLWQPRFTMLLLGVFAGLAVLLGGVGIYGVVAYSVVQRTQEIGVRMALGARPAQVLRMMMGQGMSLVMVGLGIGLVVAILFTRAMATLLYGVSATDPWIFVLVSVLLAAITLLATVIPARRASRTEPMIALRYE
jgi:putative ABC transport system permease protein